MKNNKFIACLMSLLLLLSVLAGCKEPSVDSHPDTQNTAPAQTLSTTGTLPTEPEGPVTWPTLPYEELYLPQPENRGSSLCEYDPDRRLYIVENGMSLDIYSRLGGHQLRFSVISKDPINMDTVSMTLPVPYEIELLVFQRELKRQTEWVTGVYSDEAFPYYLYQAYRGIDFTDDNQQNAVLEDFKRLQPEHLPEFYAYTLVVMFPNNDVIEEPGTIEYADITIEGETYRVDPGNIRLHTEEEDPVIDYMALLPNDSTGSGEFQQLYSDGILRLVPILNYKAEKETVLSKIYMVNEGFEILGVEVSKSYQEDGKYKSIEFVWDGNSPLMLNPGDTIQLRPIIHSEELDCMQSFCLLWFMMDFYIEGVYYQNLAQFIQLVEMNWYELYAIVFDGLDMESYYRDYYYTHNELWRNDYKNG